MNSCSKKLFESILGIFIKIIKTPKIKTILIRNESQPKIMNTFLIYLNPNGSTLNEK